MLKLGKCKCCFGKVSSEAKLCPHCGQPEPFSGPVLHLEDVLSLIKRCQKIEAIKLVRDKTGYNLKDAKDYVDSLERKGE